SDTTCPSSDASPAAVCSAYHAAGSADPHLRQNDATGRLSAPQTAVPIICRHAADGRPHPGQTQTPCAGTGPAGRGSGGQSGYGQGAAITVGRSRLGVLRVRGVLRRNPSGEGRITPSPGPPRSAAARPLPLEGERCWVADLLSTPPR